MIINGKLSAIQKQDWTECISDILDVVYPWEIKREQGSYYVLNSKEITVRVNKETGMVANSEDSLKFIKTSQLKDIIKDIRGKKNDIQSGNLSEE